MKPPKNFYSNLDRRKQGLPEVPEASAADAGKALIVSDEGLYELGSVESLPAVTSDDAGKVLMVNDQGEWVAAPFEEPGKTGLLAINNLVNPYVMQLGEIFNPTKILNSGRGFRIDYKLSQVTDQTNKIISMWGTGSGNSGFEVTHNNDHSITLTGRNFLFGTFSPYHIFSEDHVTIQSDGVTFDILDGDETVFSTPVVNTPFGNPTPINLFGGGGNAMIGTALNLNVDWFTFDIIEEV